MRIAHVITGLGAGGTPVMLHKLLAAQQSMPEIESCVVGLISEGPLGDQIRDLGIPVTALGMTPSVPDPRALWRLARTLRAFQPDLIQSWLYHADLMSSLVRPWVGRPPVVWNLRHATLAPARQSLHTLDRQSVCLALSHFPSPHSGEHGQWTACALRNTVTTRTNSKSSPMGSTWNDSAPASRRGRSCDSPWACLRTHS